jgi:hypothetical protein
MGLLGGNSNQSAAVERSARAGLLGRSGQDRRATLMEWSGVVGVCAFQSMFILRDEVQWNGVFQYSTGWFLAS